MHLTPTIVHVCPAKYLFCGQSLIRICWGRVRGGIPGELNGSVPEPFLIVIPPSSLPPNLVYKFLLYGAGHLHRRRSASGSGSSTERAYLRVASLALSATASRPPLNWYSRLRFFRRQTFRTPYKQVNFPPVAAAAAATVPESGWPRPIASGFVPANFTPVSLHYACHLPPAFLPLHGLISGNILNTTFVNEKKNCYRNDKILKSKKNCHHEKLWCVQFNILAYVGCSKSNGNFLISRVVLVRFAPFLRCCVCKNYRKVSVHC